MLELILIAAAVMPFVWLASELQSRAWLRVVLGIAAMLAVFCISELVAAVNGFNSNAYFGFANKSLIETTIGGLEKGHAEKVLEQLIALDKKYEPTYENRANYEELVEAYANSLKEPRIDALD
jgi:hypothetical protein